MKTLMKKKAHLASKANIKRFGSSLIFLVAVIVVFLSYHSVAQGFVQSGQPVNLGLEYFKVNEETFLTVSLARQDEDSQTPLEGVVVDLFLNEISRASKLGSITTDEEGRGRLVMDEKFDAIAADTLYEYTFIAALKNDDLYDGGEAELTIRQTELTVDYFVEDGENYVVATLMERVDTGEFIPVEWEELLFEVERTFGLLPVAEYGFTNSEGSVEIEYPRDLPGDEEGNIVIVIRLEEHPDYGNVEFRKAVSWGVPVPIDYGAVEARTWMSRDAPLFFVVIFWGGLMAAFTAIGYVIYNVFKITTTSKYQS